MDEPFIERTHAALAFEAFEESCDADLGMLDLGELLEKIATALEYAEASTNPGFHPSDIIENRTAEMVFCRVLKIEKRLKEFFANDRIAMSYVGHENGVMDGC